MTTKRTHEQLIAHHEAQAARLRIASASKIDGRIPKLLKLVHDLNGVDESEFQDFQSVELHEACQVLSRLAMKLVDAALQQKATPK